MADNLGEGAIETAEPAVSESSERLDLDLEITKTGPCQKHLRVRIPREDVDRYFDKELSELVQTAVVPGFRPGKSPRKLIAHRFRKEVADQVKVSLIARSLEQIGEESKIEPLTQPELDFQSIELPDEGDFLYEFDVEVRPDFEVPEYKNLTIRRPVKEYTEAEIDAEIEGLRRRWGTKSAKVGPIAPGDYADVDIRITHDGKVLQDFSDVEVRIDEELLFRDGKIESFAAGMAGAGLGDARDLKLKLSDTLTDERLRGQVVEACFVVKEVKELQPATDEDAFEVADVSDMGELRDAVHEVLKRRLEQAQFDAAAKQVTAELLKSADWELPPSLVQRMSARAVEQRIMTYRDAGYSDEEIRWRINVIRQNAQAETIGMLHKSFLLQAIAEKENLEVAKTDLDDEVAAMARNANESPRRVRARIDKDNLWEVVAMNVLERKTIRQILSYAKIVDEPLAEEEKRAAGAGIDMAAVPEAAPAAEEPTEGTE